MKIAVLIQCHKNLEQVNRFLKTMEHPAFDFYIHVDKKTENSNALLVRKDVFVLPLDWRVDAKWATITLVDATMNLMKYARQNGDYDYYWLCSGQDFPIKSPSSIVEWFETHPDNDFLELYTSKNSGLQRTNKYDKRNEIYFPYWILGNEMWKRISKRILVAITGGYNHTFFWAKRRAFRDIQFFFGSEWVCLSRRTMNWALDYLSQNKDYYRYMRNCNCPDESFFQTLIMSSPYAGKRLDYLHYVDWSGGKSSPKMLGIEDYPNLMSSDKLMARKFDQNIDSEILDKIEIDLGKK